MSQSQKVLKPTGTCFDDINDLIYSIKDEFGDSFDSDKFRIVHGLCEMCGVIAAHAWVEYQGDVYEVKLNGEEKIVISIPADEYENAFGNRMKVLETTAYTLDEALRASAKYGNTTGPWEESYRAHCPDLQG